MTSIQQRILCEVSDGGWVDLSQRGFSMGAISSAINAGIIRRDRQVARIIGSMFTVTPKGEAILRADA